MDKDKETKVETIEVKDEPEKVDEMSEPIKDDKKEEPKKAEPKKSYQKKAVTKKVTPKVDKKAFVERKLKAINSMSNAFLAKAQADRLMSRR